MQFADRYEAGRRLAEALLPLAIKDAIILALPRGGVPVGYEVARLLQAPLSVIVARKISLPQQPEFGIGAIAEGNVRVLDTKTIEHLILSSKTIEQAISREIDELNRRVTMYRNKQKLPPLQKKTVILVDDGLATGVTACAAVQAVKKLHPKKLMFAIPVCALDVLQDLEEMVDTVFCLMPAKVFKAVGLWYENFEQVSDEEVVRLLELARHTVPNKKARQYAKTLHPQSFFHH